MPITHSELVPAGQRLVIVAPHPDDEVLGCAGILAGMKGREADVLMIAVTDGEASHPGSRIWTRSRLRQQRPEESARALALLGLAVDETHWRRLRLPDTAVAGREDELVGRLLELIRPGDRVVSTWQLDGHCDHEATGRAVVFAAAQKKACLVEVPVWAWHWAQPNDLRIPWHRARKLLLGDQLLALKRVAVNAHVSQVTADDQSPAVLTRENLDRLLQPFELVFV
ncbi:PIG-L family deacetylase [Pseudomonas sp. NFX15]